VKVEATVTQWVEIGNCRIACGDCLQILPELEAGSVDAVVTDPPYGIGYAEWDMRIPDLIWLENARRIARTVMLTPRTGQVWEYPRADWMLAWYRPGSVQRTPNGKFSHWEPILVYGENRMWCDARKFNANTQAPAVDHPCPKPVELMLWLIDCGTEKDETVLDPFMGSGTTGVACIQTGRKFLGIEIEPKYFSIAEKRIRNAWENRQGKLF